MSKKLKINLSLAAYHGFRFDWAMQAALDEQQNKTLYEPALGEISLEHVQIVPQLRGAFTVDKALEIKNKYPDTQFRLHANVRLSDKWICFDLSNLDKHEALFKQAGQVQKALGSDVYSAHSGETPGVTLEQVFDNAKRASDIMQCSVAVEGLYPSVRKRNQILTTWKCYQKLLESDLPFALDLSHLKIVQNRYKENNSLIKEMLSSDKCLEVHVSDNDGTSDKHDICADKPFWFDMLINYTNPDAVVFTEGNRKPLLNRSITAQE